VGPCPEGAPDAGDPCTPPPETGGALRIACEYGSDPHCTTTAQCESTSAGDAGTWNISPPDPSCEGNPVGCPATFGLDGSSGCPVDGACTYPEGRCSCVVCERSSVLGRVWVCAAWPMPDGCPEPRPRSGTPCVGDGGLCGYGPECCGQVNVGPAMQCVDGYWEEFYGECPCVASVCPP
jgi:hypothetical protein